MKINLKDFTWVREPKNWIVKDDVLEITTEEHTDLWQRTYYHFRNDNAPCFQIKTDENIFHLLSKHRLKRQNIALINAV